MKIALSHTPGSGDNIEEFMKKVDDGVSLMNSLPSNLSTLGQVLKATKAIMDRFSQVVHLSSLNLIIIDRLIEIIGTSDTRCIVDHSFQSLWGESFYELSNSIRYSFTCRVGCTGDGSPRWFHTRTSWHLARNVGYCKYDSWSTSNPEHIRCHCRDQPSIATGCVAHSWIYEIVLGRWFFSFFYPLLKLRV